MKTPVFKGSCTAIVTPFDACGVDCERLRKNLDFQYENGTAAIVVCGTTGENATLSNDEHQELVRAAIHENAGRMKVIVGVGGNNTLAALKKAESARAAGADATTPSASALHWTARGAGCARGTGSAVRAPQM